MSSQALYLRWRPQIFDEMIGQDHIVHTLLNSLRQDRMRHAYLFSGPRGTGKTTTARLLAKAVNCQRPNVDERPCGECHNCVAVAEGRFFDLIEIDAASHTGVDDVRDLRDKIAFAPSEGRYKVYIIDEVHRFSGAAFDALLKTLEEPPAHAIFVLATTELDKVPATIKSRCLLFEFRRVSLREVVERLQMICDDEGISVEPAALELIARQGTGSVRDSISLLDQVLADPNQHVTLELAQNMLGAVGSRAVQAVAGAIIEQDAATALDLLNEAMDMGADPRQFGQQMVDYLRQVMLVQIGGREVVDASDEMRAALEQQASRIERRVLLKAIRSFNTALTELKGGWQPQLPLELAIVESTQGVEEAPAPVTRAAPSRPPAPRPAAPPPDPIAASPPVAKSEMTLGQVSSRWDAVLQAPQLHRHPVQPVLREHVTLLRVENNTLVLGTHLPKFKDNLERDMELITGILQEVLGQPVKIRVEKVDNAHDKKQPQTQDEFETYGLELGGEINEL